MKSHCSWEKLALISNDIFGWGQKYNDIFNNFVIVFVFAGVNVVQVAMGRRLSTVYNSVKASKVTPAGGAGGNQVIETSLLSSSPFDRCPQYVIFCTERRSRNTQRRLTLDLRTVHSRAHRTGIAQLLDIERLALVGK